MRFPYVLATLLIGASAFPANAQDAQSLIAKNLEARGGAAALDAIKTLSFTGRSVSPGGFELTYKEAKARMGAATADRLDLGVQGLDLVQSFDGREAWRINPFAGRKDAETMSADEARSLADNALIDGPLLASRTDGSKVQYLGREDFDGTNAYKLKITQKDGDEFVYWLDPDTFLEIKVAETRRIRGAQQTTETELGDYEKVAGVYFPMSAESWGEGHPNDRQRLIIASGTANGPIDPSIFAQPRGAGTPAKAGGEPPDASEKPKGKPAGDKPTDQTTPPSSPPKGE